MMQKLNHKLGVKIFLHHIWFDFSYKLDEGANEILLECCDNFWIFVIKDSAMIGWKMYGFAPRRLCKGGISCV